jgi:hypothetical protein
MVSNKSTTLLIKGICTSKGKTIQAMKNTSANGVKYSNGMRYVTPKWKCVKGAFNGSIEVTGVTKMDIYEEPGNHTGTNIAFKVGQKVTRFELSPPEDPEPYVAPPVISDNSVGQPVIKSLKFIKGTNPPTVYKLATIELSGKCTTSGITLNLYWNLVTGEDSSWTLVKKNIECIRGMFTIQAAAFPGLQYRMQELPSKNYSLPWILPKGKLVN